MSDDLYFAVLAADGTGRVDRLMSYHGTVPPDGAVPANAISLTASQYADCHANPFTRAWTDDTLVTIPTNQTWQVPERTVVERIIAAGKLRAAYTALLMDEPAASLSDDQLARRERWKAGGSITNTNAEAIELLTQIGLDPALILAPV